MKTITSLLVVCLSMASAMIEIPLERHEVNRGTARQPVMMVANLDGPTAIDQLPEDDYL